MCRRRIVCRLFPSDNRVQIKCLLNQLDGRTQDWAFFRLRKIPPVRHDIRRRIQNPGGENAEREPAGKITIRIKKNFALCQGPTDLPLLLPLRRILSQLLHLRKSLVLSMTKAVPKLSACATDFAAPCGLLVVTVPIPNSSRTWTVFLSTKLETKSNRRQGQGDDAASTSTVQRPFGRENIT